MKYQYEYKRPDGDLYRVSMRDWQKVFAKRGRWPFIVAYVYVNDKGAVIHFKTGVIGKVTLITLLPLLYLIGVFIEGHREAVDALKRNLNQDKYGAFSAESATRDTKSWSRLGGLIGREL